MFEEINAPNPIPASSAMYIEPIARPLFSSLHRSTVHAAIVGPMVPQLAPKIADPINNNKTLCAIESTANAMPRLIAL